LKVDSGDHESQEYLQDMRILFIVHRVPYPPNKGDKLRAFWELQTLARHHEVDLFCFYDDPEDTKHFHQLSRYCRQCYVEKLPPLRSRVQALFAVLLRQPFSTAFFFSRTMSRRIEAALRSESYDKIFVFSSSMAQYVESVSHNSKILDLVDVDSDKWEQYAKRSRWPWSWLWRAEAERLAAYEASIVQDFSMTLVCTDAEAQLLRSIAPNGRIEVVQNFLDVDEYDPARIPVPELIRSWQPYIIFSGSMDYFPNVDAAGFFYREVFPLIRRELPKARFVIAGRNPHHSIAALRSDPAVQVTGPVTDMKPYLCGASAAVVPMRIARGVQNKILEALAAGVPVVSTSAAACALPMSLRSLLLVADSPVEIAAAVVKLIRQGAEIPQRDLRSGLKDYIEALDLPARLDHLIVNPTDSFAREESVGSIAGCDSQAKQTVAR
jgi:sugar transferase (PEP-CTERM/EpsH1 system associated)